MKRFAALLVGMAVVSSLTGCLCWPGAGYGGGGGLFGGCPGGNCGVYGQQPIPQGAAVYGNQIQAGVNMQGAPIATAPIMTPVATGAYYAPTQTAAAGYYVPTQTAFAPLETLPTY
ncbi:MAG: hypothetical protein O3A00_10690 [Planctomycetota bacterium]|nr:hypothetical protein [Planctomycetota bacterium]